MWKRWVDSYRLVVIATGANGALKQPFHCQLWRIAWQWLSIAYAGILHMDSLQHQPQLLHCCMGHKSKFTCSLALSLSLRLPVRKSRVHQRFLPMVPEVFNAGQHNCTGIVHINARLLAENTARCFIYVTGRYTCDT